MDPTDRELEHLDGPLPDWFGKAMSVPREEGRVEVDGCPIRYLKWGQPGRPGVVMLHGFLAHARCFAFIAPLLAGEYQVVAYDVSGYGDSGHRSSYPDATRARETLAVAEHAGLLRAASRPVVIGHSYGSTIAMSAVEGFPDAFGGLIVCDVLMLRPERLLAFRANASLTRAGRSAGRARRIYPDLETAMQRFRLAPPQSCENQYLVDYVARHSLEPVEGGWTWKFHPSSFALDGRDDDWWLAQPRRFVALDIRKAVVYGENSLLFDADTAAYLRELGAEDVPMVAVPDAQHHLMLDQPLAFASALRTLLSTWRSEPGSAPG